MNPRYSSPSFDSYQLMDNFVSSLSSTCFSSPCVNYAANPRHVILSVRVWYFFKDKYTLKSIRF